LFTTSKVKIVDDAESDEFEICVIGHEISGKMFIWYFLFYPHFFRAVPLDDVVEVES
jgi:hypothetical protein